MYEYLYAYITLDVQFIYEIVLQKFGPVIGFPNLRCRFYKNPFSFDFIIKVCTKSIKGKSFVQSQLAFWYTLKFLLFPYYSGQTALFLPWIISNKGQQNVYQLDIYLKTPFFLPTSLYPHYFRLLSQHLIKRHLFSTSRMNGFVITQNERNFTNHLSFLFFFCRYDSVLTTWLKDNKERTTLA